LAQTHLNTSSISAVSNFELQLFDVFSQTGVKVKASLWLQSGIVSLAALSGLSVTLVVWRSG